MAEAAISAGSFSSSYQCYLSVFFFFLLSIFFFFFVVVVAVVLDGKGPVLSRGMTRSPCWFPAAAFPHGARRGLGG